MKIDVPNERVLFIRSIETALATPIAAPFVTLVSAVSAEDLSEIASVAMALVDAGCNEFCCIGREAHALEDRLDEIVELNDRLNVLTSAHEDVDEGLFYFLYAAGGREAPTLLALVEAHPKLVAAVQAAAEHMSLDR